MHEIRFAKGRFVLICSVIGMLTLMVVLLSALTNGLQSQSISAIDRLPGETLVLQEPPTGQAASLAQSTLPPALSQQIHEQDAQAAELGITSARLSGRGKSTSITIFGADPKLMPTPTQGELPTAEEVMISASTADELGLGIGDTVTIGEKDLQVAAIAETGYFAHTPVIYTTVASWQSLSPRSGITAVILFSQNSHASDIAGTTALTMQSAKQAVPGYKSENSSLQAMQVLLLIVSALVIGTFFTVWTNQRQHDLAVVRAIGASKTYLLSDGLGQALIVLILGEIIGTTMGVGIAIALKGTVPITLTLTGIGIPILAMGALGITGAFLAVRKVTNVDPLMALSR